jgi:decaprenylphospho-beta-D-erythro-pentofuranosid-2-ulose 2-reductase
MNDAMGMPQTAVVVGGTSDIARAVLRDLVPRRLSRIVLAGRDAQALESAAKELEALGVETSVATLDVTAVEHHAAFAEETAARLGQIDLVLLAAGMLGDQETDALDPVATHRVLDTNCSGPAAVLTAFATVLRRQGQGRIVVLSSVAGVRVRPANYVYGGSKAGLDGFTRGLAAALAGSGVTVTVVRPGWVATRMTAGRAPAPFATTADAVAADVVKGLERGAEVVWSPAVLRLVFAGMRFVPEAIWRRLPD